MKKLLLLATLVVSVFYSQLYAQCGLQVVDLTTRVSSSELIVEAGLIDQESFRDPASGNIYTANYLKIYKIFKGEVEDDEIVLLSPGGQIGDSHEEVMPSIYVSKGITGIFFLIESDIVGDESLQNFKPFSGPQACIYYSESGNANDVFNSYNSIENELYVAIEDMLGSSRQELNKLNYFTKRLDKSSTQITAISPDTTVAGIKEEIEITGLDFGESRGIGRVEFNNASTGQAFVQPGNSQYRFWSDTLIIVRVPHNAGTGIVKVTQNGTGIFSSPFIKFSHLNYSNISKILEPYHKDNNGNGGFTWSMSNQFDGNSGAKNAFIRAMTSWSDQTCINWENGPPTSVNRDMSDGINIVRFADSTELPMGVLGITRNRWRECNTTISYTGEIDLSYSPTINWHTATSNPPPNKFDLESVIVHELGHAHQLGHVKDRSDFMFATVGAGQNKRDLIDNDVIAGLYIMKRSVVSYACGPSPMQGISGCSKSIPVGINRNQDIDDLKVYPNPFSNILTIENTSNQLYNVGIFNILGKQIDYFYITQNTGRINWNVPSNLPEGLYMLKNLDNGKLISKVILSR